ncbi:MAG: hypothetical protein V3V05_03615 [Pontiella sp.]
MQKIKNSDTARTAFTKRQANIDESMKFIQEKIKAEAQSNTVNWAHVGSLGHVEELLQQVIEFMG